MRAYRSIKNWLKGLSKPTLAALIILLAGCGVAVAGNDLSLVDSIMNKQSTKDKLPDVNCLPGCSVDFNNYVEDAKRSIDPKTVQYCTYFPPTPGVKPFTIPIVGDMTSSSVSFFPSSRDYKPGETRGGEFTPERRSYDGMYHGSPPPYRYGFDAISDAEHKIIELASWCTDTPQPAQIQETTMNVKLVEGGRQLTNEINAALKRGDKAGAAAAVAQLGDLK